MTTETRVKNQPAVDDIVQYTTGYVTSKDGTTIGYRQLGQGPGVVLLHGAMESAQSHMQLARGWLTHSPSICLTAVAVASVARMAKSIALRRMWRTLTRS